MLQDYYTGEMRGIGFVEFADERTAEDAQRGLDRMFLEGREVRWLTAPPHTPLSGLIVKAVLVWCVSV
jgi:RNA recognition motif-containing protein